MPISLNTNALTTLDMAKTYLKIPLLETSQDEIVKFWINAASDGLENAAMRKFKSQAYTEFHHGRGNNILLLRQWPILSTPFPQIFIDGSSNFAASTEVPAADIRVGDDLNTLILLNETFPNGYHNVKVIYTAGLATVPSDLENAALWVISWFHKARESGDIGRENKSKGDETVSFMQQAPGYVREAVHRYKRTEFPSIWAPVSNI